MRTTLDVLYSMHKLFFDSFAYIKSTHSDLEPKPATAWEGSPDVTRKSKMENEPDVRTMHVCSDLQHIV